MAELREQAVLEMAKTYFYEVGRRSGVDMAFETAYDEEQADFKYVAGLALDALVGFLADHADEWWEIAKQGEGSTMERRLLAVLSGETGKETE